ncbi:MAG TPA: DUF1015 domain-containing protein, partial [Chloroflexota bacterium]|nr:DUF1015 domain-containing protein [Chloroflexota bacterium]
MPRVLPFAGLRYAAPSTELERLISPPYDVVSAEEQAELQALSPNNAIYVELPTDASGEPRSRYRLAAETLARWRSQGVVAAERRPAFCLTETEYTYAGQTRRRRDLLAALELEPWSSQAVLPHEHTMAGPKADRLELMRATHLNASPIWVLHRDRPAALEQAWTTAEAQRPTVEFTWRGEEHRLWVVDDPETVRAILDAFEAGGPLYIADGHHRYETSLAFKAEAGASVRGAGGTLATLTWADDPGLLALPTHRLLTGVAGSDATVTLEEAETRWSDAFHVEYYPVWDEAPAEQIDALMQQLATSGQAAPSVGLYGLGHLDLFGLLELRGRKA